MALLQGSSICRSIGQHCRRKLRFEVWEASGWFTLQCAKFGLFDRLACPAAQLFFGWYRTTGTSFKILLRCPTSISWFRILLSGCECLPNFWQRSFRVGGDRFWTWRNSLGRRNIQSAPQFWWGVSQYAPQSTSIWVTYVGNCRWNSSLRSSIPMSMAMVTSVWISWANFGHRSLILRQYWFRFVLCSTTPTSIARRIP